MRAGEEAIKAIFSDSGRTQSIAGNSFLRMGGKAALPRSVYHKFLSATESVRLLGLKQNMLREKKRRSETKKGSERR